MEQKIKQGNTVNLKSGGPVMTYISVDSASRIICKWFNDGELKEGRFTKERLIPVTSKEEDNKT